MKKTIGQIQLGGRGFSLMEVLLAVFILGIGLIMVATIFPVGADWTRQSTEASVGQTVGQNAVTVIRDFYSPSNPNTSFATALAGIAAPGTVGATSNLVPLPGLSNIPVAERAYQFGNANPFPAPTPANCSYYWTALVRVQPGSVQGASRRYDLYVLVFRKGDRAQTFTAGNLGAEDPNDTLHLQPTITSHAWVAGTFNSSSQPMVTGCVPPIGYIGIGLTSGTVFTQVVDLVNGTANPRPLLAGQTAGTVPPSENVIYGVPADGTTDSPLIYVYQTTLSF